MDALKNRWASAEYLILDEVSMMGGRLFAELAENLSKAKSKPDIPFGGVTVLFTGDFRQLPPVGDDPLYRPIVISKSSVTKSITGRQIWNTCLADAVILTKQMRVEDPEYYELLQRVRYGKTTVDDYHRLRQRVIDNCLDRARNSSVDNHSVSDIRWLRAPIAVTRNNVRARLNNIAVLTHAHRVRQPILISPASDTWSRKSQSVVSLHEADLAYVTDDKTEHLPTWLPLVEHQPVMVTANIATELGLVNGTMASIVAIIQHPDDNVNVDVSVGPNQLIRLSRPPECVLVRLLRHEMRHTPLHGLESDVLPVFPITRNVSLVGVGSFARTQLPLVPAFAVTDFKVQGKTYGDGLVVDLTKPPTGRLNTQSPYVLLSRVKRFNDIAILRSFDRAVLNSPQDPDLLALEDRLVALAEETKQRHPLIRK